MIDRMELLAVIALGFLYGSGPLAIRTGCITRCGLIGAYIIVLWKKEYGEFSETGNGR